MHALTVSDDTPPSYVGWSSAENVVLCAVFTFYRLIIPSMTMLFRL